MMILCINHPPLKKEAYLAKTENNISMYEVYHTYLEGNLISCHIRIGSLPEESSSHGPLVYNTRH